MTVLHDSHCVTLDSVAEIIPPDGAAVMVVIAVGSCSIQRRVNGEWADHVNIAEGAVLVMQSTGAVRLVGAAQRGVAVFISETSATAHLGHLSEYLAAGRLVRLSVDPLLVSLGKALSTSLRDGVDMFLTKHVVDVLVTRLGQVSRQPLYETDLERTALPNWRLRRVISYVDERLDEGISLAEMAAVAGLSAMYFASQFKAATGMRPHHYVIARRIQHAKHLLHQSEQTVLDIALAVGFRTQSHFTTVFKQHEAVTPARWRRGQLAA